MLQDSDVTGTDGSSGRPSVKDKKRTLTHLELLDRYYDEGKIECLHFHPVTGRNRMSCNNNSYNNIVYSIKWPVVLPE